MEFKGKLAVVTGAASGIGRSVALALAKLGTDIVVVDIDDMQMQEVCREIASTGRSTLAIRCDVSKNNDVENMAARTISAFGVPDIFMNNAGIGIYGNNEKITINDYEAVLNINVLGVIRGVLAFLPEMVKRGSGHIINTASRAGYICAPQPYSLSKYTIIGYSEGLFCYLQPKGINVSVLCPAGVRTNLFSNATIVGDEKEVELTKLQLQEGLAREDNLEPDDVAQLVIESIRLKRFLINTPYNEKALEEAMRRGRDFEKLEEYLQTNYK